MTHVKQLTPTQLAVLEVFRRLHDANLPEPTMETVCQLAQMKAPTAKIACDELVELGLLVRGGRTSRSFTYIDPVASDAA